MHDNDNTLLAASMHFIKKEKKKTVNNAAKVTLSRNVLGLGPLFLGPYSSLSRSLRKTERQTPILSVTGAKCTEDTVFLLDVLTLSGSAQKGQPRHLTSAQKRQTGGSPKYSPPAPKCCICELKHEVSVRKRAPTHSVRMATALACELQKKSPSCSNTSVLIRLPR